MRFALPASAAILMVLAARALGQCPTGASCGHTAVTSRTKSRLREVAVQEPLAVIGAVSVVAVDPDGFALRRFRDEVITPEIAAVPPSRLDAFGTVAQDPGFRCERGSEGMCLVQQPRGTRRGRRERLSCTGIARRARTA